MDCLKKLLSIFALALSLISCTGQKTVSVYLAHCDSLFYMQGDKFNIDKIRRGKMNDSAFVNELFSNISPATHKLLFKPYSDVCTDDGMGPFLLNWQDLLKKKGFYTSKNALIADTDSIEDNYFGDISIKKSILNMYRQDTKDTITLPMRPPPPPDPLEVNAPTSVSNTIAAGKPVLLFLITKDNKIYYKYDSSAVDKDLVEIKPVTTNKIVQAISKLEKQYKVTFNENNVFIKGDGNARYAVFSTLKDALKQKEIFKFKVVTTTE